MFSVPSGPPSNVSAITTAPTSVNISWNQLPNIDRNGVIITYEVQFSWNMGNVQLDTIYANTSGASNQLVFNRLQECVQYSISVRAYTSQGHGPFSAAVLDSSLNSESTIVLHGTYSSNPFDHDPQCMLRFHNHRKFQPVPSLQLLPILHGVVLWKRTIQSSHSLSMSL